jgi:SAM-dependent methyltransferase
MPRQQDARRPVASPSPDATIAWYGQNAKSYVEQTQAIDLECLYAPFLESLPKGAHILDAGCGSGRDTAEFISRGYKVTAIDACAELAKVASERAGIPVEVMRFQDMGFAQAFDGVWTCASLLHVPRSEIDDVIERIILALHEGGIWFMSVMIGDAETWERGRLYNKYTQTSLRDVLSRHPSLEIVRLWETDDVRLHRPEVRWVNVLARKAQAS